MIRFNCATCGREYVLADALRHLPLLCKQCGHRLVVPDPQPEPVAPIAAPPAAELLQQAPAPEDASASEGRLVALPSVSDSEVDLFMSAEMRAKLAATAAAPEPVAEVPPLTPVAEPGAPRRAASKALPVAVDAFVTVILLALGMFVGEAVAGESTGHILSRAGSAPKFPPTDLLLWLGCVGFFGLLYGWLGARGWTVGGWLKRRAS
ncbi:MAG TPA: hypothetical protein VGI99_12815 [Gemmataceae bacterium]|jgi:DNA-directed RNA polymerase subunit RPC12/RpoP